MHSTCKDLRFSDQNLNSFENKQTEKDLPTILDLNLESRKSK